MALQQISVHLAYIVKFPLCVRSDERKGAFCMLITTWKETEGRHILKNALKKLNYTFAI